MRHVALVPLLFAALDVMLAPAIARAACAPSACLDAEPAWLAPASTRFAWVADTTAPAALKLAASATFAFRLNPAVLTVPSPSRDGRDVNLLRYAVDATLGLRLGLGNRMEATLVAPVGLYQRGSGIKGITDQNAPPIAPQSIHDARVGFGYAFDTGGSRLGAKLRFEAKLPNGNKEALSGEPAPVASPSLLGSANYGNFCAAVELGARLRRPIDFYGTRVGSQAVLALAIAYELPGPHLSFALEQYVLPSLVASGRSRSVPAEWLGSIGLAPTSWRGVSVGLAAGAGLPFSETPDGHVLALGVPTLRAATFVRFTPPAEQKRP